MTVIMILASNIRKEGEVGIRVRVLGGVGGGRK